MFWQRRNKPRNKHFSPRRRNIVVGILGVFAGSAVSIYSQAAHAVFGIDDIIQAIYGAIRGMGKSLAKDWLKTLKKKIKDMYDPSKKKNDANNGKKVADAIDAATKSLEQTKENEKENHDKRATMPTVEVGVNNATGDMTALLGTTLRGNVRQKVAIQIRNARAGTP